MPKPSFYIENLGCAKNQVDAEIYGELLTGAGFIWAAEAVDSDLIIVNTCGFIRSAKEESIQETLELRAAHPDKKIILAGCFAQRYGDSAKEQLPEIDGIIGNRAPEEIVAFVETVMAGENPVSIPGENPAYPYRGRSLSFPGSMYVKIAEGCNNGCSYCAIPVIRGPLRSREIDEIVAEVRGYLDRGALEIILLAQDLAAFGTDGGGQESAGRLPELLRKLGSLNGDFWIRLLYIHPDHFSEELPAICRDFPKILPYFDIPFQHVSPPVLRGMGRKGDAETYLGLLHRIRSKLPDASLRSTFMVGFPGEGEDDYQALLDFQEKGQIDWLGVFTYSREEDTKAFDMEGPIKHRLRQKKALKRKELLEERQRQITTDRLKRYVGSRQRVLIEEAVEGAGLFIGRTAFQAPDVDGLTVVRAENLVPGTFVDCIITKVTTVDLEAVLAPPPGT